MEDGDKRDKRKIILRGDGSTEINFDFDQWRRREGKGDRGSRGRAGGGRFSAGASNQISLMKWSKIAEPAGPGATDILSWAP